MNNEINNALIIMLSIIAFIVSLIALWMSLSRASCLSKWEHSGMPAKWEILSGCQVKLKNNTYIPSNNYCEIEN